jgi:hypothetical protein
MAAGKVFLVDQHDESTPENAAQTEDTATPRFATPPRPDKDPRPSVSPTIRRPQPTDRGRLSVWEAVIGAVVAGPSALAVVGLNSTLTGDEGDAGPGFLMVAIAFMATLVVAVLAILAVKDGVATLRSDGHTRRSRSALVGIALGVLELVAVTAVVVAIGIWLAEPA